jgi:hypothetical protein
MIAPVILSLGLLAGPAAANAQSGLAEDTVINDGLLVAAVADKIRRECDTISARYFRARAYLNDLRELAVERGYTEDQVDAYINNSDEKAKMRERRNAYFTSQGASNLDADSLCVLGRDEIARQTQVGALLKAK